MMVENQEKVDPDQRGEIATPVIHVDSSPHLVSGAMSTRGMMIDVLIALTPVVGMAVYIFHWYAVRQLAICITSCMAAEALFMKMRNRPFSLKDCSAIVTGTILALSLPGTAPWYVGIVGSFVAIGIGKVIFGGVGMNIFNPAMVGRAFVMITFPSALGAPGYEDPRSGIDAITRATPMEALKQTGSSTSLSDLFWGFTNGSLGEVSAIACIIGGLYLCRRRTASWEIPAGVLSSAAVLAAITNLINPQSEWTFLHHLMGGSLLFGAFFIATDPVTSPLTPRGKFIFGAGIGTCIMVLRLFSGYPEGVMFAVLMMNAMTPLINRWTIPRVLGAQ